MSLAMRAAKSAMTMFSVTPPEPSVAISGLSEVFRHPMFTEGDAEQRNQIMLASAALVYEDELRMPWDVYFGRDLRSLLTSRDTLDLGCFTGGRTVAWAERYEPESITGVDVSQVFVDAASLFAESHRVPAAFRLGRGEDLPFDDCTFDAILSFDVLEHVQDPARVLRECRRVLRSGGRAFLVFPSFFHPIEHHLSLASLTPFVHYFFGRRTIIRAYSELVAERGEEAAWYRRASPEPYEWERGNTINGLTVRRFRRLARDAGFTIECQARPAIGAVGRRAQMSRKVRVIGHLLDPLARMPVLEEALLHRAIFILAAPSDSTPSP